MSSRSSFLTSFVSSARLVGVVGTGLLAGYDIGLSHSVIPALVNSSLPGDRLVAAWNQIFNSAAGFVIPVIVGSTVAFLEAAYRASIRTTQVKTIFGLTNGRQLVIAAFAAFATLPYSAISVTPVIYRLKGANKDIEESRSKEGIAFVDAASVKEDVEAWGKKNAVRAVLFTASFVLGLTAV
ncbi:hypothetical protein M407DRAFT_20929 [Tulasnella calospora MUT 4182]|uniref:DUF1772-domain-containing protein n=1 Tax=Tulasnella calospora MUT 4182 TaxID=1051891 RepID=A0A0C3KJ24_9AGAM|nr:hypothetical protein M407DRAFT_28974 [Tulasnella calospora MUT 4182]KIO30073.1 hypothetical protein M407DRAFT_20929 [Tulasnella calospora MUT 4182]